MDYRERKEQVGSFPDSWVGYVLNRGPYDKNSIMQYNFQLRWYSNIPNNPCKRDHDVSDLLELDKQAVVYLYGEPVNPGHAAEAVGGGVAASPANPQVADSDAKSRPNGWANALTDSEVKEAQDALTAEAFAASVNSILGGQNMKIANHICILEAGAGQVECGAYEIGTPQASSAETHRAEATDQLARSINDFTTAVGASSNR
jgi:hypothetical protein